MSLNSVPVTVTQPKMSKTRLMAAFITFPMSCFLSWILYWSIYLLISITVLQYHRTALRHKLAVISHLKFSLGSVSKSTSFRSIVTARGSSWSGEARGKTKPRAGPARYWPLATGLGLRSRYRQPNPLRGSWSLKWLCGERRQLSLPACSKTREGKGASSCPGCTWTLLGIEQPLSPGTMGGMERRYVRPSWKNGLIDAVLGWNLKPLKL